MKDINHLNPIYRSIYKCQMMIGGRSHLRKYLIIRLLGQQISELKFNLDHDFPFNPKHCPKVAQRRIRKACYQSFALYKKSHKPKRFPRFRIIKDEFQWFKKDESKQGFDDCSKWITAEFHLQYMKLPDPEPIDFGFYCERNHS